MTKHLAVDQFLELVAGMPDCEALMEIESRRAILSEELNRIEAKRHRKNDEALLEQKSLIQADLTQINFAKRVINERGHRAGMRNAVQALFGNEGVERVLIWMEQHKQGAA